MGEIGEIKEIIQAEIINRFSFLLVKHVFYICSMTYQYKLSMFFKNFKYKNKIIILLGEDGAVLLHIKNNVLVDRCFIQDVKEFTNLKSYIASDKRTHIYLVLNHIDQDYTLQNIPDVGRLNIYSIVRTKLKHIPNNNLKAAFLLSQPNKSEESWQYMFVSIELNDSINSWLELIISSGGNFKGMLMLPIEMVSILNAISSNNKSEETRTNNSWNIVVVCTRTGGFRQLVTKNNKMVFTRLISFTNDTLQNVIAGSIYQEIQNTIQYLGRFDFNKNDLLNLYIVVPQDIKFGLTTIKFSEDNVNILTPYELSKALKLTYTANPNDKFCDTVLLYSIIENKPTIVLHTKQTKEFLRLTLFNLYFPHFLSSTLLLLFIINALFAFDLYSNYQRKNSLLQNEEMLKIQLQDLNNNYNIQEMYEISEMVDIHNILSNFNYSPLSQIKYINKIKIDNLELKSFYWKIDNEVNIMDMKLKYHLQSDSDVFHKYEDLKQNLNTVFYNHKIGFSELPSVVGMGEKDVMIDVNINKIAKE